MTGRPWSWREAPPALRTLARGVTVVQLAGYTLGLLYVWATTRLVPSGIADHYRGNEAAEGAMEFPKSFAEMLTVTHTHLLAMAAIFVVSGLLLIPCARVGERWKRFLVGEPFVALLVSFAAMWLMRYHDPRWSYVLALSSGIMAVTFYIQSGLALRELGWRDR